MRKLTLAAALAALVVTTGVYAADKDKGDKAEDKPDAALLKPGENTMTFTVPAGNLQSGVVWDYLRLEVQ